jgi:putative molybdopterin biosynthesis protein
MRQYMENHFDVFMNVKQVSDYLHLNEKKIYSLVSDGKIPATKITGKWLFPRELIDRWMLDSTHNGLLHDRLIISGCDDPLLHRIVLGYSESLGNKALVTYTPTGTRSGLSLLESRKVDICCMHWGPENESYRRHPSLIQQYSRHSDWVLIRAFKREQGLIMHSTLYEHYPDLNSLFSLNHRWSVRQKGSGAQRFLMEELSKHGLNDDMLEVASIALSEREAASAIIQQKSDIAPGTRAIANEFGLQFISLGWQAVDFVIPRNIWFRHLFQNLIKVIQSDPGIKLAEEMGGYDISNCGELVWGDD